MAKRSAARPASPLSSLVVVAMLVAGFLYCAKVPGSRSSAPSSISQPTVAPTRTALPPVPAATKRTSGDTSGAVVVRAEPTSTRRAASAPSNTYTIIANALNVRAEADGSSTIVAVLGMCEQVVKLDQVGNWLHVRAGQDTGYISSNAKYVKAGAGPCVTPTPGQVIVSDPGNQTTSSSNSSTNPNTSTSSHPSADRQRIGATCNDGWASGATGSGACSWHGGVRCWRYSDGTCTKP